MERFQYWDAILSAVAQNSHCLVGVETTPLIPSIQNCQSNIHLSDMHLILPNYVVQLLNYILPLQNLSRWQNWICCHSEKLRSITRYWKTFPLHGTQLHTMTFEIKSHFRNGSTKNVLQHYIHTYTSRSVHIADYKEFTTHYVKSWNIQ